jgi:hypothetical protein
MPKAKPISLHPLDFDEVLKALVRVDPEKVGFGKKKPSRRRRRNSVNFCK